MSDRYNKESKELTDLTGMRFGRLTVLYRGEDAITPSTGKHVPRYMCVCDCGNKKLIRKFHLTRGLIVSCGCFQREQLGNIRRTHGFSHKERLYGVWLDMKERCRNPKNNHYHSYGGRGIRVCDEWDNDYMVFRTWCMNNGYEERIRSSGRNDLTLDRIDVNGNYCPDNCRFITNKENCLNKRDTMTDEERYSICPICGKPFTQKKRNGQQTCSPKCGQVIKFINYPTGRKKDVKS